MEKKTVVLNLFGGPGSGKTTCAWEIASKLKKMGYVTEYVPEYAKELVWDKNYELLDGSLEHQQVLLKEQNHRVNRLLRQVDFVVTDSPVLLNGCYLKETNVEVAEKYKNDVLQEFKKYNNFCIYIQRGDNFEKTGRIHNEEEPLTLDQEIKNMLKENKIIYSMYAHNEVDLAISNCVRTYEHLNSLNYKDISLSKEVEIIEQLELPVKLPENIVKLANNRSLMDIGDIIERKYESSKKLVMSLQLENKEKDLYCRKIYDLSCEELKTCLTEVNPYDKNAVISKTEKGNDFGSQINTLLKEAQKQHYSNKSKIAANELLKKIVEADTHGDQFVEVDGNSYYKFRNKWTMNKPKYFKEPAITKDIQIEEQNIDDLLETESEQISLGLTPNF